VDLGNRGLGNWEIRKSGNQEVSFFEKKILKIKTVISHPKVEYQKRE